MALSSNTRTYFNGSWHQPYNNLGGSYRVGLLVWEFLVLKKHMGDWNIRILE